VSQDESGREPLFFDENQLSLLGEDQLGPLFSEEEKEGIYTAQRLHELDEDKFKLVCNLLADPGISYRRITKATGCHHYTLKAVEREFPKLIEAEKERIKLGLANVASKSLDLINDNLEMVPVKTTTDLQKLQIVAAVAIEKHELLAGNATSRVARQEERLEDIAEVLANLPAAGAAIDADFTEITGFDGQAPTPKELEPLEGAESVGTDD
jgi:hypothetical protein